MIQQVREYQLKLSSLVGIGVSVLVGSVSALGLAIVIANLPTALVAGGEQFSHHESTQSTLKKQLKKAVSAKATPAARVRPNNA